VTPLVLSRFSMLCLGFLRSADLTIRL
jgi:hypothetical protein